MSAKPAPPPTQAFNDVLARMMQAEENEGGPPSATPCDTPVEVISQIRMPDPEKAPPGHDGTGQLTEQECESMLTEERDRQHRVDGRGTRAGE